MQHCRLPNLLIGSHSWRRFDSAGFFKTSNSLHGIPVSDVLVFGACRGVWFGVLGKVQLVQRIFPVPLAVLYPIVIAWIFLPLTWSSALRARRILAPLVLLGIVVSSLLIYPHMQDLQKRTGRGTDQPDCVTVAAKGIATGHWPYDTSRMWDHMPMSCGPGWVLLYIRSRYCRLPLEFACPLGAGSYLAEEPI